MNPDLLRGTVIKISLALSTFTLIFLTLEIGLRIMEGLNAQERFETVFREELPSPPPGTQAGLAHLIQPSTDPDVIYELRPNLDELYRHNSRVNTDESGSRHLPDTKPCGPEPAATRAEFCIVGIGDSVMFGQGVSNEDSYLNVLARLWRQEPNRAELSTTNLAVPGFNTYMEVAQLEHRGIRLNPDLVIIDFVGNDLSLPNFVGRAEAEWLGKSRALEFVMRRLTSIDDVLVKEEKSALGRLARAGLEPAKRPTHGDRSGFRSELDLDEISPEHRKMVGWKSYEASVRKLGRLSREHDFQVLFMTVMTGKSRTKKRALELALELGFNVFDGGAVLSEFLDSSGQPKYLGSTLALSKKDGHPSALGHSLIGQSLVSELAKIDGIGSGGHRNIEQP